MGDSEKSAPHKANVSPREFKLGTHRMNQSGSPPPVTAPCQACWIGFRVVDEAGKEVTGTNLRVQQEGKAEESTGTDEHGKLHIDKIPQAPYTLISMTGPQLFRLVEVKESPANAKAAKSKP